VGAPLVEEAAERATTQPPVLWAWAETLGVVHRASLRDAPFGLMLGGAFPAFVPLLPVRRAPCAGATHGAATAGPGWAEGLCRSLVRGDRNGWAALHGDAASRTGAVA